MIQFFKAICVVSIAFIGIILVPIGYLLQGVGDIGEDLPRNAAFDATKHLNVSILIMWVLNLYLAQLTVTINVKRKLLIYNITVISLAIAIYAIDVYKGILYDQAIATATEHFSPESKRFNGYDRAQSSTGMAVMLGLYYLGPLIYGLYVIFGKNAQQVDSAEASTIAVPPFNPSGSPR